MWLIMNTRTTGGMSVTSASYSKSMYRFPLVITEDTFYPSTPHLRSRLGEWMARGTTICTWVARTGAVTCQKALHLTQELIPETSFLDREHYIVCGMDGRDEPGDGLTVPDLDPSCMHHAMDRRSSANSLAWAISDTHACRLSIGRHRCLPPCGGWDFDFERKDFSSTLSRSFPAWQSTEPGWRARGI